MSPITVPDEVKSQITSGFTSGGVRLPFPVIYLRWLNGRADQAEHQDARFFGGWEVGLDAVVEYLALTGKEGNPAGFTEIMQYPKDGDPYPALITRWVGIAPIGMRKRWRDGRSHTQILGYLAEFVDRKYNPWGVVVLTAYGWASNHLEQCLEKFSVATAKARQEHAPGVPSQFFFHAIGTFGDRTQRMVGKGNAKSPITPCTVHLPEAVTKANLESWFVGDLYNQMSTLRVEADDWLTSESWLTTGDESDEGETPEPPENFPTAGGEPFDDIPF